MKQDKNSDLESKIANGIRKERYASNHAALAATGMIILGIIIATLMSNFNVFWICGVIAYFVYQKIANNI